MIPKHPTHGARAVSILARSLFRALRRGGYADDEILAFATALVGLLVDEASARNRAEDPAPPLKETA